MASEIRDEGFGRTITYSRKVFIPLTHLCRDTCHYCTFARPPRRGDQVYMTTDEVLAVIQAGQTAGCTEALFTLGDKPELHYRHARDALHKLGHNSTLEYLRAVASLTLAKSKLLRGATEVCVQGGIHPSYTGETYLAILRAVKSAVPEMHVHAFSPLEIQQGASTLGMPLADYLCGCATLA